MFQVNPLLGMKSQALFSLKDESEKLKCRLLKFLFGAFRVKVLMRPSVPNTKIRHLFSLVFCFKEDICWLWLTLYGIHFGMSTFYCKTI